MRKVYRATLVMASLLILAVAAFGQGKIASGNVMIGASLTNGGIETGSYAFYNTSGTEVPGSKTNKFDFSVSTNLGYFLLNGFEVGPAIRVSYRHYSDPANSSFYTKYTDFGIGAQAGYFQPIGGLTLYGAVTALYLSSSTETASGGPSTKTTYTGFSLVPEAGLALFLESSVALQVGAYFDYHTYGDSTGTWRYTYFGLSIGVGVFL